MKANELIALLQCVDGDTQIAVCGECGLTNTITLWDWTDTHGAVVLVGIDKQDWTDMNLPYTEDDNERVTNGKRRV